LQKIFNYFSIPHKLCSETKFLQDVGFLNKKDCGKIKGFLSQRCFENELTASRHELAVP